MREETRGPDAPLTGAQRAALAQTALRARRWLRSQVESAPGAEEERPSVLLAGADREAARRTALQLARELGLDLYCVYLGTLVSKFMAETEKNLGRALETAERTGAVLLFDESDALFGERSASAADRYARLDIEYLQRRLDDFPGLAILACRRSLPELGSAARRFGCVIDLAPSRPH